MGRMFRREDDAALREVVTTLKEEDLRRFTIADDGSIAEAEILLDQRFGRLRAAVIGPDGALRSIAHHLMDVAPMAGENAARVIAALRSRASLAARSSTVRIGG